MERAVSQLVYARSAALDNKADTKSQGKIRCRRPRISALPDMLTFPIVFALVGRPDMAM
jgi:hypothetical protein